MIVIIFNRPEFEYDVHSLVKAFFPNEDVEMYYTCEEAALAGQKAACTHHSREELMCRLSQKKPLIRLDIDYGDRQIGVRLAHKGSEDVGKRILSLETEDRIAAKRSLGRALYEILSEQTGQTLPWGTLIGIRPTKIPMKLLEEGKTGEEIAAFMREAYLTSEKKIALAIEIAERERRILENIDYERGYSLYIGIPFCPSTCLYCSFTSYPLAVWEERLDDYLTALEKEIDFVAEHYRDRTLNSVYIGGGTPTTLTPAQLTRLIGRINQSFDLSHCLEFTVEAGRPDSITRGKLEALRDSGISRISVNPQTMKQKTLDIIGRQHTVGQTIESFYLARKLGFSDINMDLIIGLPGETLDDVRHTMEVMRELSPDNITIHSLAVKRAARLNLYRDYYREMEMVNTQEHMQLCEDFCRGMGLTPYYLYRQKGMAGNMENVGYASEGKAGVYNILIMEEKQTILALGAGATTKFVLPETNPDGSPRIERVENVKDVKNYLERIDEMIARKEAAMIQEE